MFTSISSNKNFILNLLLAIIPASFIAGNTIINFNIMLIIILGLIFYKFSIFKIRYFFLDKLIFLFFLFIIFTGIYNDINLSINNQEFSVWKGEFSTTIKSFAFLRFFLLYLVIRFLYENDKIDIKLFFLSSTFFCLFVCLDLFYQLIFGEDIFGFKSIGRKLSGPFGDELIAGSFIQRFSLFSFFVIPLFLKKSKPIHIVAIFLVLFTIFISAIVLSGNRMPLIIFILSILLLFLFQKETRKFFIPFILLFSLIFTFLYKTNTKVNLNFQNFKGQVVNIVKFINADEIDLNQAPNYIKEFSTFYQTWLMNKYVGGGIKNFRYNCHNRPKISSGFFIDKTFKKRMVCNMHPHNYYLEVLTEVGLIGFSILIVIFSIIIYLTFFKMYFKKNKLNNYIIAPFVFLFISEIFPIKSTGSFFTTGNATYLFLILSFLVTIMRKNNLIENRK